MVKPRRDLFKVIRRRPGIYPAAFSLKKGRGFFNFFQSTLDGYLFYSRFQKCVPIEGTYFCYNTYPAAFLF